MGPIEQAIREFQRKRSNVYRADPDQAVRDARAVQRAAADHAGRWIFELLQNAEDAKASEVRIIIQNRTVFVADNGIGFRPESVDAICGTDFSDKESGTIGRKGVGFKSVYGVCRGPQVLNVGGEGIEFDEDRGRQWLADIGISSEEVPYAWIPFFLSWEQALQQDDGTLASLSSYRTVVKLPLHPRIAKEQVEKLVAEWPPHALIAFRHLRRVIAPRYRIELTTDGNSYVVNDSREHPPTRWRVASGSAAAPRKLLRALAPPERKAIGESEVGFLVAAPLDEDAVIPTAQHFPVHVFYPTEQLAPVRLLLHAEFVVKSDRTAIIPFEECRFNEWLATKLGQLVCRFVNEAYRPEDPAAHIALLAPLEGLQKHPAASALWQRIEQSAQATLRLPDATGVRRLALREARWVAVSVRPDLARGILAGTALSHRLLHSSFDANSKACRALRELGARGINEDEVLELIAEGARSNAGDTDWIWSCWQWLAAWAIKGQYGEQRDRRIEAARKLPVLPVGGFLREPQEFAGSVVTWRAANEVRGALPKWLPLKFVDDWLGERLSREARYPETRTLAKELAVVEPQADVIQRATGLAIEKYWEKPRGDPGRFLSFILGQDWIEVSEASEELQRCPVPLAKPVNGQLWAEARKAYFGSEWGNGMLAELYAGCDSVAWVARDRTPAQEEKLRSTLEWLGVSSCPRIVVRTGEMSAWQLPEGCKAWRAYLANVSYDGRSVKEVAEVAELDQLAPSQLDLDRAVLLVRLLVRNWQSYYQERATVKASGRRYREWYDRSWDVKSKWWWEVSESLRLPVRNQRADAAGLSELWVPEKETDRRVGRLLPVVALDRFEADRDAVKDWLIKIADVRSRIEDIKPDEWREILSSRVPRLASEDRLQSDERMRHEVSHWYDACLEALQDRSDVAEGALKGCPLLCRRANSYKYVGAREERYLNDDDELSKMFGGDVWLLNVSRRNKIAAAKYFSVLPLSESVEGNPEPQGARKPLEHVKPELQGRLKAALPFVWALRASQSKEARLDQFSQLRVLVVKAIRGQARLGEHVRDFAPPWWVDKNDIFLTSDQVDESHLAKALARAVKADSEWETYEYLLSCESDEERKRRLLEKKMGEAEVDRFVRDYREREKPGKDTADVPRQPPDHGSGIGAPPPRRAGKPLRPPSPESKGAAPTPSTISPSAGTDRPNQTALRLKDLSAPCVFRQSADRGGSGFARSRDFTRSGGHAPLTPGDQKKVEEAGRQFARRELEKLGFNVEMMPFDNPGFDLRATKEGVQELRVEVKAHARSGTIIELTRRQYDEYSGQGTYTWELWNIEHLAEGDPKEVAIGRYAHLPEQALDAVVFRVDLRDCNSAPSEE